MGKIMWSKFLPWFKYGIFQSKVQYYLIGLLIQLPTKYLVQLISLRIWSRVWLRAEEMHWSPCFWQPAYILSVSEPAWYLNFFVYFIISNENKNSEAFIIVLFISLLLLWPCIENKKHGTKIISHLKIKYYSVTTTHTTLDCEVSGQNWAPPVLIGHVPELDMATHWTDTVRPSSNGLQMKNIHFISSPLIDQNSI